RTTRSPPSRASRATLAREGEVAVGVFARRASSRRLRDGVAGGQTRGDIVRVMQIAPDLLQQVVDHALRDAPDECCGFVWLRDGRAEEVVAVENTAHSPFRFE